MKWEMSNYNIKKGWFFDKPLWHEATIKYDGYSSMSEERNLMLDWIKTYVSDMEDSVIWHDTKNHLKVKFKDERDMTLFILRWA